MSIAAARGEITHGGMLLEYPGLEGTGLRVFSTTRAFDPRPGATHEEIGERILDLLATHEEPTPHKIISCRQVHGTRILDVDGIEGDERVLVAGEADGLFTTRVGFALVSRSADCVPMILAAPDHGVLAALHSGWRGTYNGLMDRAIDEMEQRGIDPRELSLWIGPRVCGACYEVSEELAADFGTRHGHLGAFRGGRRIDLGELNRLLALSRGVCSHRIVMLDHCTAEDTEHFPSHRRDGTHRGLIHTVAFFDPGSPNS